MEHGLALSLLFFGNNLKPEGFILVTPNLSEGKKHFNVSTEK